MYKITTRWVAKGEVNAAKQKLQKKLHIALFICVS